MKIIFLSIIFLFLSACSKIETGLQFAPRLIGNKIDDAFDFKSKKLSDIKKQLDLDIQNSKKSLAIKLAGHLDQLELIFFNEPSVEKMASFFDQFSETQTLLLASFRKTAEITLTDLLAPEIKHYQKFVEDKYKDELKKTVDRNDFIKDQTSAFFKVFEFF